MSKSTEIKDDLEYLQKSGEEIALQLGIETEEDVERIAG